MPVSSAAAGPAGQYKGTVTVTAVENIPDSSAGNNIPVGTTYNGYYTITCTGGSCTISGFQINAASIPLSGGAGKWTATVERPGGEGCPPHTPTTIAVSLSGKQLVVTITSHYHKSVCSPTHYTEISGATYRFVGTLVEQPGAVPTTTVPAGPKTTSPPRPTAGKVVPATRTPKLNANQLASLSAVARGKRSTVPASLTRPDDAFDGGIGHVVKNALLAGLLVLLLVFPSQLFNNTYSANQDRVDAGLRRLLPWRSKAAAGVTSPGATVPGGTEAGPAEVGPPLGGDPVEPIEPPVPVSPPFAKQFAVFGVIAVAGALLGQFLDPHLKADAKTLALFVGILLAIAVDKLVEAGVGRGFRGAVHQSTAGILKSAPLGLLIALLCVVVSRATHFQPGYLYGLIGGWAFTSSLSEQDEGRQTLLAVGIGLLVALIAWFVFPAVADSANGANPGFGVLVVDSLLAGMFIGGVEGLLFGLTPLRFMPGHALSRWSWGAWGVSAFAVAFVFVQVLLNPNSGYLGRSTSASIIVTCVLFLGFGLASVLFWAWFRTHPDPEIANVTTTTPIADQAVSAAPDLVPEPDPAPDEPPSDPGPIPPEIAPA